MTARCGDDVEQVTMIPACSVGPFPRRTAPVAMIGKADVEAATGRIMDIAHQPVMALAASVRRIAATHRLGIFTKTARNIGGGTGHAGAPSGGPAHPHPPTPTPNAEDRKRSGEGKSG